jgi:hypothetical protein
MITSSHKTWWRSKMFLSVRGSKNDVCVMRSLHCIVCIFWNFYFPKILPISILFIHYLLIKLLFHEFVLFTVYLFISKPNSKMCAHMKPNIVIRSKLKVGWRNPEKKNLLFISYSEKQKKKKILQISRILFRERDREREVCTPAKLCSCVLELFSNFMNSTRTVQHFL